jgi:hypothetical protein
MAIHLATISGPGPGDAWTGNEISEVTALMEAIESVRFGFKAGLRGGLWEAICDRPPRPLMDMGQEIVNGADLDASAVRRAFQVLVDDGWLERTETPFIPSPNGARSSVDGYYVCRLPLGEVEE